MDQGGSGGLRGRGGFRAVVEYRVLFGRERIGVFGATCLNEFVRRPGRLPRECAMTVPVRHGRKAKVYEAECLRDYGYRSAYLEDR